MNQNHFNIRVYGIWMNEHQEILLSDERIGDFKFTKFPGGGLEYGEGSIDCLKREWQEELNMPIEIIKHFYTTDFFQLSAFHTNTQIISIYYLIKAFPNSLQVFHQSKHQYTNIGQEEIFFRWKNIHELKITDVDLPIDQKVVALILSELL